MGGLWLVLALAGCAATGAGQGQVGGQVVGQGGGQVEGHAAGSAIGADGVRVTPIRDLGFARWPGSAGADTGALSRGVNGATGLLRNLLKTYTTDPVLRPVSSIRSLAFLVENTLADIAERVAISVVHLPAVTRTPVPPIADAPGMELAAWERELDRLTGAQASTGSLEFLVDGDEFFPALVESIGNAQRSVDVRTYIFDNDDFAIGIADLLKARSHEIDVKVTMDGIGTLSGGLVASTSMPGTFEPPPSIAEYLNEDGKVEVRTLTNPWFSGDHAKVTIVDQEIAYVGGMNIGREYRFDWHDLMVEVRGAVVADLGRDFDDTWARSGTLGDFAMLLGASRSRDPGNLDEGYPVRVLHTSPGRSQIYEAQLAAIRRARRRVFIENPYFSDDAVLFELIAARRRGVDVRFVIAQRSDAKLMDMSNVDAINTMLANGIRVYLYPGMTHAKATIVDGWLMVGSANLDKLSMRVNREINVAASHPAAVRALEERLFEADFAAATELSEPLPAGLYHQLAEMIADVLL
ncbi:MAG: phosphatidylserine/phosphatidylglycerophosphate/cardiolipin synthase family protein [Gammaproteobacteria bacterium]|nr:phosphatidylserine/phosphatidylglycerophosphate/cardiolipin synthase family protein [Gammaproteobacteria bacterium]